MLRDTTVVRINGKYYEMLIQYSGIHGTDDIFKRLNELLVQVQGKDIKTIPEIYKEAEYIYSLMISRNSYYKNILGTNIHRDYVWGFGGFVTGALIVYAVSKTKSKKKK